VASGIFRRRYGTETRRFPHKQKQTSKWISFKALFVQELDAQPFLNETERLKNHLRYAPGGKGGSFHVPLLSISFRTVVEISGVRSK